MSEWWRAFFDADYVRLWGQREEQGSLAQVEALWSLLALPPGSRVLDATKPASLRVYAATELVRLLEGAGLRFMSAQRGCSPELFRAEGPDLGGRLGLLAQRPT